MSVLNPRVRAHRFLESMYSDGYFPGHLVDKGHAVLLGLCERIETVARGVVCREFRFIAAAYGFADADPEELVVERDW